MTIPYDEIDSNIVELVRTINLFPGVVTESSCGGHRDGESFQKPEGEWEIFLTLETEQGRPTAEAWTSIEMLAFAFTKVLIGGGLRVVSGDPFLNVFSNPMSFIVEGHANPDEIAVELNSLRKEFQECREV